MSLRLQAHAAPEEQLMALARGAGYRPVGIEPLTGDVGRRRYFRLHLADGASVVAVAYTEHEREARQRWLAVHRIVSGEVRTPRMLADDGEKLQIIEDFGRRPLAQLLSSATDEDRHLWLRRAAFSSARWNRLEDPGVNSPFDAAFFYEEMDRTREALFDRYQGRALTAGERAVFEEFAGDLSAEIASHPRRFLHRDFHGDNLFPVEAEVGVIDFQDARSGPDTYDVASLLYERTSLSWISEDLARRVLSQYAEATATPLEALRERLPRVLLQRAFKAAGTFAAVLALGREGTYQDYLPRQIALVRSLLSDRPVEAEFRRLLERRLRDIPLC